MRLILKPKLRITITAISIAIIAYFTLSGSRPQPAKAMTCTPPPAPIVSWWTGNGTANDLIGNRHGSPQNGATFTAGMTGLVSDAFSFDGVDDFVQFPSQPVSNYISAQFTIEFWANPGAVPDRPTFGFLGSGTANTNNPIASYDTALSIGDGVGGYQLLPALDVAAANTWTHYAIVDDGASYKIYKNGLLQSSTPITANPASGSNRQFVIGQSGFGSPFEQYYKGLIDEFTIFSAALTGTQIQDIYNAGSAGKCANAIDLKLTKSASPTMPDLNSMVTYTYTVQNLSSSTANNVVFTDNLPSTLTYVPGSCMATGGGVCGGSGNNRTVTFTSLAGGATATITISATVSACLPDWTTISNTATVNSTEVDTNPANNSATADVQVCDTTYIDPYYIVNVPPTAGSGTINVYTQNVCSWTASVTSGGSWLSIGATSGGPANTTLSYSWLANGGSPRQGTIKVTFASGRMFELTVVQGVVGVPYLAGGKVYNLTRTGGVPGVTMTFSKVSGPGPVPGPVMTDANGNWSQSGFQRGTIYQVRPSKTGYNFRLAFQQFSTATTNLYFYQY